MSKLTPLDLETCFNVIRDAINSDPEYAWGWQCNLAVGMMDATGVDHFTANRSAALIMYQVWGVDITTNSKYPQGYGKSVAQRHYESRSQQEADECRVGVQAEEDEPEQDEDSRYDDTRQAT